MSTSIAEKTRLIALETEMAALKLRLATLEATVAHAEARRKPGPKPGVRKQRAIHLVELQEEAQ